MPQITALYRYPVKGLTPESLTELSVGADGRVVGDRVLGVRLADNPAGDEEWSPKAGMLVLMNTPALARLQVHYDHQRLRLRVALDGAVLAEESLDPAGRGRLAAALADYAGTLDESPLRDHPERLPLRIVGDGRTGRFQDNPNGQVTLHSRASLSALAGAFGDATFDERRFRSNLVIDGVDAWEEQTWVGRTLHIGTATFTVDHPSVRCLATHANPATGERDRHVMTTLTHAFSQEKPTFAVHLRVEQPGEVRVGDEVKVG